MAKLLGIDTSNYTTSAALLDSEDMTVVQAKKLLPVKKGEKGIRQSDAVFHHTRQLPEMISCVASGVVPDGIGVSVRPRLAEGSYMPCFLVGESAAYMIGSVCGVVPNKTSHQIGHILAALYSCARLDLVKERFIAFHVSGGTTDMLLCSPDENSLLDIRELGHSLDLKAGQAIDRTGVMLGLDFPCGAELERLALQSGKSFRIKPVIRGNDCSLSGIENKCKAMLDSGDAPCDIARFCLDSVYAAVRGMTRAAFGCVGRLPVVYAGGVMSDRYIADRLSDEFDGLFAEAAFSCDNAAGTAVYSALVKGLIL